MLPVTIQTEMQQAAFLNSRLINLKNIAAIALRIFVSQSVRAPLTKFYSVGLTVSLCRFMCRGSPI